MYEVCLFIVFNSSIWAECALFKLTWIILISVLGKVWEHVPPPVRPPSISPSAALTAPGTTNRGAAGGRPCTSLIYFYSCLSCLFAVFKISRFREFRCKFPVIFPPRFCDKIPLSDAFLYYCDTTSCCYCPCLLYTSDAADE